MRGDAGICKQRCETAALLRQRETRNASIDGGDTQKNLHRVDEAQDSPKRSGVNSAGNLRFFLWIFVKRDSIVAQAKAVVTTCTTWLA
jgi:hypothetical protein